jgi:hypothetical protein
MAMLDKWADKPGVAGDFVADHEKVLAILDNLGEYWR